MYLGHNRGHLTHEHTLLSVKLAQILELALCTWLGAVTNAPTSA